MSAKNMDNHNRWRSRTVAFRVSEEEARKLDIAVKLSGLNKQSYITSCLLDHSVVVQGNPRVFKALRDQMASIQTELQRIEAGTETNRELLETIQMVSLIMDGMKEDDHGR